MLRTDQKRPLEADATNPSTATSPKKQKATNGETKATMPTPTTTTESITVWDTNTQQYHGGQEWKYLNNFVEDFSVTTNGLGTPKLALKAAREALDNCHHYPPADQEPAKSYLAKFLHPEEPSKPEQAAWKDVHERLLLGNGASELIDLVTRIAPMGAWRPGPWKVQYKEYERAAASHGRAVLPYNSTEPAALYCIVNPNNPTGDYMPLPDLKSWIEANVADGASVMVDESMQIWHTDFRNDSLLAASEWISELYRSRNISIYIMHSWTKIWSCTGLRLGSVVCPTVEHTLALKKLQVPWSVNVSALRFLEVVTSEEELPFLKETWGVTTEWRAYTIEALQKLQKEAMESKSSSSEAAAQWTFSGEPFISWVWIDFIEDSIAAEAVIRARRAGVPIRPGTQGYKCNSCVRIAVREPRTADVLMNAWKGLGCGGSDN